MVLTAGVRTMFKMVARLFGKDLIRFEALTKLAQQWSVCVCHWECVLSQLTKS